MSGSPSFPSFLSIEVQDLISGLLDKSIDTRMEISDALKHDWFVKMGVINAGQKQSMVKRLEAVRRKEKMAQKRISTYNRPNNLSSSIGMSQLTDDKFITPDNSSRLMKKTKNANFSTGEKRTSTIKNKKVSSAKKPQPNQLGNKKVSNFNAESVFNENAINRAESLLNGPDTNIFNFGESTITTVSSLSGSDISGLTVRQLADLDPRRAFDELAIKYKRLKSENKSLMMMIRVKNLTIKDLEQTLENVKNSVGVKTEDEGEMSEESYNEIFTKMKEFEAQKSKFEEMELKLAELQPLTNIKQEFDELEEKFNLLKSKSISLYQEKQKLEEDNMTLSGLVVKYKNEKADILRVSQNAVQDLKAQNDQYLQEIEKLQLLKIPEVDLKILKL